MRFNALTDRNKDFCLPCNPVQSPRQDCLGVLELRQFGDPSSAATVEATPNPDLHFSGSGGGWYWPKVVVGFAPAGCFSG